MTPFPKNYLKQCYNHGFLAKYRIAHANHPNTMYVLSIVGDTQQHRIGVCVSGAYPLFKGIITHTCKIINNIK